MDKAQIASKDCNPERLNMKVIEVALCKAVEMHDDLVNEDFIDSFVSQVTPLSDARFSWCLDFSPQATVAFLNLAGQRKYTTYSMESKLHFDLLPMSRGTRSFSGQPAAMSYPDSSNSKCTSLYTQGMYGAGWDQESSQAKFSVIYKNLLPFHPLLFFFQKSVTIK